jgi:hypothetical protein
MPNNYELKTPPVDFKKNYKTVNLVSVLNADNLVAKALNATCYNIQEATGKKVLLTPAFNRDIDIKRALETHDLSVSYYNVSHVDDGCNGGTYKYYIFLLMKEDSKNRTDILKYASEIKYDLTRNDYIFTYENFNSSMSDNDFIQQTQVTGAKLESNSHLVQMEIDFNIWVD